MEMHAGLTLDRNRKIKRIHQKALAASDPAPHIDPARNIGPSENLAQGRRTSLLELQPVIEIGLQTINGRHLRLIGPIATLLQGKFVILAYIHTIKLVMRQKKKGEPLARPLQRSEEHTSELQSLMRISYAVFC